MIIPANELKSILKKLSGVKTEFFHIQDGCIRAQDSDVWIEVSCPVFAGQTPFTVVRKIIQDVNRFSGDLEIEREDSKLVLKSKKARREIPIQAVKPIKRPEAPLGYLTLDWVATKGVLSLASQTVSKMKSVEYGDVVQLATGGFRSIEDNRPEYIQAIGFDSVVMTRVRRDLPVETPFNVLINLSAIQIVQLMDGEKTEFGETENGIHFNADNMTVIASKPAKKYPDYEKFIPENSPLQFSFDPIAVAQSLKIVEPTDDGDGSVGLHFADGVLQLFSVGASDEIEYEQLTPDPVFEPVDFITRVNYKHLQGIVSRASDKLLLSASGSEGILRFDSGDVTTLTASMYRKEK